MGGGAVSPWLRAHLLLFPPTCWDCGRLLPPARRAASPGAGLLCPACHAALPWLRASDLAGAPPDVARLWAACRYGAPVDGWIQLFKYDRRDALVRLLATLLRDGPAARGALAGADVVVPVPLHRRRLWQRGFNQSLLLAHALRRAARASADGSAAPPLPALRADLLVRHRYTRPQVRMSAEERRRNVADAFSLHSRLHGALPRPGLRVLLVDDVSTTGATLSACARVLRAGGAARVEALVIAHA